MRAFVVRDFEKPGAVEEIDDAVAGDGEVLVRVHTASVNSFDATSVTGSTRAWAETRVPFVPGIDCAGVVEALGGGVDGFAIGDPVIANAGTKGYWGAGTFAELVAVPADAVFRKPPELDDVAAATVSLAGLTALAAVDALELGPGSVVVTIGGTGGVGSWFVGLAAERGAIVVALVRPENAEYAEGLGADEVVDYTSGNVGEQLRMKFPTGFDALADFSGNTALIDGIATLLRAGGKLVSSGSRLDKDAFAARGLVAAQANRAPLDHTPELLERIVGRHVHVPETTVIPLEEVGEAITAAAAKHTRGKVVVRISE